MRTRKVKAALVAVCIMALGAGVFAGMAVARMPAAPLGPSIVADHTPLSDELGLSPEQRDQMRVIWEGVRTTAHETLDSAQTIQKERDDAVLKMLTDEQKVKYAAITQQAAEQFTALSSKRDQAFRDGVSRTKLILNDSQRQKYNQIISDRIGQSPAAQQTVPPANALTPGAATSGGAMPGKAAAAP